MKHSEYANLQTREQRLKIAMLPFLGYFEPFKAHETEYMRPAGFYKARARSHDNADWTLLRKDDEENECWRPEWYDFRGII